MSMQARALPFAAAPLLWLGAPIVAPAQTPLTEHTLALDKDRKGPPATVADVAWLAGRWTGEGFGGVLEETWNPPLGGAMVATFRLVRDGKPEFYEICLLAEHEGSLAYKVKHFHPDLTGWEEKKDYVTFPLVQVAADAVYFHGLTLRRDGDRCTHYLAMRQKDGTHREAALVYKRADAAAEPGAAHDVSLAALAPLLGAWSPAEDAGRVVHDYQWTVGRQAMRLREGYARGAAEQAELDGTIYGDPAAGSIGFVAVAGPGVGQGRLFRGSYRALPDGRIERVYTVHYRTAADTPGEELGGTSRRYREVYTIAGDRLDATLEWWREGAWQPFGPGKYALVRAQPAAAVREPPRSPGR
jgi:hypothetical protein